MRNLVFAALALLAVSLGFGIWTAIAGLPYSTALFTLHKLTGAASAVLCIVFYFKVMRTDGLTPFDITLGIVFSAALILLLVTGGILGARQSPTVMLRIAHGLSGVSLSLVTGWKLITFLLQ